MRQLPLISFPSLRLLLSAVALLFFFGSAGASDDDDPDRHCETTPVSDRTKVFSVLKEIASYSAASRDQRGVSLPVGAYMLEAQDASYWYFRAPAPIGFRQADRGRMTERRLPGGVRIAKHSAGGPAGGYIDDTGSTKELIYEISAAEFTWMEGVYWKKNF